MLDALVMAGALRVAVLDMQMDAEGWYVARSVAGVVEVVEGDWSGDGVEAFTFVMGAPLPQGNPQADWLRQCRTEAVEACRSAKQELCWVYAQHNGGTPNSSAVCLFACKVSGESCPPYPAPTPAGGAR